MKFLVNPLVWCLLLQMAGLGVLQRRMTTNRVGVLRGLWLFTLLLAAFSTPLATKGLESSLRLSPTTGGHTDAPAFIFVLGGGYSPGLIPDEDTLSPESLQRVMHGITIWRRFPAATVVFSGAMDYANRDPGQHTRLMAEVAMSRGMPASAIRLEPTSQNTREHPIQALTLPGVTSGTVIGLVTSAWHMRRARREFCRYFEHVEPYPLSEVQDSPAWQDFIPDAGSLEANTTRLAEWVGMIWYALRSTQPPKCV